MTWFLGMMSGTSLDGVDAALIETDGVGITAFGRSAFRPYTTQEVAVLRAGLGCWPGSNAVPGVAALSVRTHAAHAARFPEAGVIGYHGQTLAHDPGGRGTHQAGCGAALARETGRAVVWDFRAEDVRRGGQGAPLAPFFHHACVRWAVGQGLLAPRPVVMLNLGGVGNLTWLDPSVTAPEEATLAFDTGPANAPLNDLLEARCGQKFDADGALAARGVPDETVIAAFLGDAFFDRPPPKSLDRDAWLALSLAIAPLSDADAAATLTHAAAASVAAGLDHLPERPTRILVCGGGRRNPTMMAAIKSRCGVAVDPVEQIGLDGDMLEAQAFGWLAARVLRGMPTSGPSTTAAPGVVSGGRISGPAFSMMRC